MKFRKLPKVIDAMQFDGMNHSEINAWAKAMGPTPKFWGKMDGGSARNTFCIETLEGDHTALPGDWIIRGIAGEYYPCKPDIFADTYEVVEPSSTPQLSTDYARGSKND